MTYKSRFVNFQVRDSVCSSCRKKYNVVFNKPKQCVFTIHNIAVTGKRQKQKFQTYKPLRTFSDAQVCFQKYRYLHEVTSVDFETIRTPQTRRYLLIRLYETSNILKENFVLSNLDIAIPMYVEPYSVQAQRQFRKTVENFNKIRQQYEALIFEII